MKAVALRVEEKQGFFARWKAKDWGMTREGGWDTNRASAPR